MAETDAKTSCHNVAGLHSSASYGLVREEEKKREKEEEKGRFMCIGIREKDRFLNMCIAIRDKDLKSQKDRKCWNL